MVSEPQIKILIPNRRAVSEVALDLLVLDSNQIISLHRLLKSLLSDLQARRRLLSVVVDSHRKFRLISEENEICSLDSQINPVVLEQLPSNQHHKIKVALAVDLVQQHRMLSDSRKMLLIHGVVKIFLVEFIMLSPVEFETLNYSSKVF